MYGWTDPNHPDGAARHREQPLGEEPPTWLTDRPEPRSAYLFGDDPEQPADEWHRDQPTARWQPEPAAPAGTWQPQATDATATWRPEPTDRWQAEPDARWAAGAGSPTDGAYPAERPFPADRTAGAWPADDPTAPVDLAALRAAPAATAPATAEGRHRPRRRFPRPLLIGGAAAAATLVVSLGVGAVALTGDDPATDPAAVDDTIAAAPVLPGGESTPGDTLAPPTPSTAPTTAKPTPSATKSTRPTPARTTAPSRRSAERSTAPAGGGTKAPVSSGGGSQASQVVALVNAERAKAGCGAVGVDDKLTTAAQRHSQDQADHRDMSHTGSDGSNVGTRLDRVGYSWRTYGENVAWNQKTPAAVMDAWMNSPGHRANILNCAFTEIGVGVANSNGPYWTQVFAAPR
ncbi:CAP domain-containing protein [Micromonospora sp. DSM 115977]|uniref:CAP domain-containing protein n=1 Tax=Micromonospora reichwaldensis TaxID=3075516 RepID=A0ABU2WUL1_9ACTN|nr:CAP domain-containing protein [Micromonospora sp. DSM 115977]MDT0528757.1 CAP domain-containing protein [Micromonospora sp. DSM 115977]